VLVSRLAGAASLSCPLNCVECAGDGHYQGNRVREAALPSTWPGRRMVSVGSDRGPFAPLPGARLTAAVQEMGHVQLTTGSIRSSVIIKLRSRAGGPVGRIRYVPWRWGSAPAKFTSDTSRQGLRRWVYPRHLDEADPTSVRTCAHDLLKPQRLNAQE
jgi:hypothetical protein